MAAYDDSFRTAGPLIPLWVTSMAPLLLNFVPGRDMIVFWILTPVSSFNPLSLMQNVNHDGTGCTMVRFKFLNIL